jgi:hypothetical protein
MNLSSRRKAASLRSAGGLLGAALVCVLLQAGCGGSGSGDDPDHLSTALVGTWKSQQCEVVDAQTSRRRTYVFAASGATITYDVFGGTACEAGPEVLTVETQGDAKFVEASPVVKGATDVLFTFTKRALTPTTTGVPLLQATCSQYSWAAGTQVDITTDGCGALVQGDTECPVEYDLAELVGGVAFFGDRSVPLCSPATRPTKLAQYGVAQ